MSHFAQFELVLLVLYGLECLAWSPGEAVLVVRSWSVRIGLARPWQVMATRRGRVLAAGWSPVDVGLVCSPWPICMDARGVVNRSVHQMFDDRSTELMPMRYLAYHEIEEVAIQEHELRVNGDVFARAVSRDLARDASRLLRRLRRCSDEQRRAEIIHRAVRNHFNTRRVAKRWARFQREARVAKSVSLALALMIFVALPALYVTVGLSRYWWVLIPIYGGLVAMAGLEVDRLYRHFYPRHGVERWKQVVLSIVAPTHAMRLADHVGHELLSQYHPAAVASVAGTSEQAEEANRETWLSLNHPRPTQGKESGCEDGDPPESSRVIERMRQQLIHQFAELISSQGRDPALWDEAPTRSNPDCVAYCPRCHAQYLAIDVGCGNCGGLALVGFDGADAGDTESESS